MCNVPVRALNPCLEWSKWFVVMTSTRMLLMHLRIGEVSSSERDVNNIHDTLALAIKKDGEGSHQCRLTLFKQFSL